MNSDDDAGGKFLGRVMGGIGLIAAYLILRGDQHAAPPRIRPPGLPNLGNTCYMNAVLQALGSLESFRACLDRVPPLPPHLSASAAAADAKGSRENQHSETSSASDKDDNINNSLCSHLCDDEKEKRKKKKKTRFFAQSTLTPLRECIHHLSTHAADSANAVGKTLNDLIDILRTRIPGFLLQDQQDSLEFLILLIDVIEQDLAARNYGEGERQRASSDALAYSSSDVRRPQI